MGETDLISRQMAIDAVNEWLKLYVINRTMSNVTSIQDILRQLPSTQPDIIRCKDCEYYELTEWVAHRCNLLGQSVYGNDFCAWAEPYKGEQK